MEGKIKQIIAEHMGVRLEEVIPEAKFEGDLGADSLDLVELTMALEAEFKIEISDEEAAKLLTVGDVFEYIKEKTK